MHFTTSLLCSALSIWLAGVATAQEKPAGPAWADVINKVSTAAEAATASQQKAMVARDMAVNALKNALAARDDTEAKLLVALKMADRKEIAAVKKTVARAAEEAKQTLLVVEKIVALAAEVTVSAKGAGDAARQAAEAKSEKDAQAAADKVQYLAELAARNETKASAQAEPLKKKWLMPVPIAVTPPAAPPEAK